MRRTGQNSKAEAWHLLPLAGLTMLGFAVAQPLFDLLGRNPLFLLEHAAGWREAAWLVAAAWLLPGLALSIVLGLTRLVSPWLARSIFVLIFLPLAAALFSPLFVALFPQSPWAVLAGSATVALLGAMAVWWLRGVRVALAVGAVAPVLFSLIFLLRPAVRGALSPPRPPGAMELKTHGSLRSVILVVLDELAVTNLLSATNEIDALRYPNFAALRDDSIWFRNCATVSGATERSVPAILTGRHVRGKPTPDLDEFPQNLVTLLAHDMLVVADESVTHLSPPEFKRLDPNSRAHSMELLLTDSGVLLLHRVLPAQWARRIPRIDTGWAGFGRNQDPRGGKPGKFLDWVQRLQHGFKPTLGFLHEIFPHNPYVYYPDGTRYSDRGDEPFVFGGRWVDEQLIVDQAWQRSLLQLGTADRLLGQLVARLRSQGLYDDAVVCVVADHGSSFVAGQFFRRITPQNAGDLVAIPCLLKLPGFARAGEMDERLVSTIDILPTIAEAAGFEIPWEVEGRSFLDPETPGREFSLFFDIEEADVERRLTLEDLSGQHATLATKLERIALAPGSTSVGPHAGMVGMPLSELRVGEPSRLGIRIEDPRRRKRPRVGFLPGEVRGTLLSEEAIEAPVDLALVLRDSVVSVTRSLLDGRAARSADWMALLPLDRVRGGRRGLRVYAIDEQSQLHATSYGSVQISYLGRKLGVEPIDGVQLRGIYEDAGQHGERQRWTNAEPSISIPLLADERPRRLRVRIAEMAVEGSRLEIFAAEELVFDGVVDESPFDREFELSASAHPFVVRFVCESTREDAQGRVEGLLLRGVWLDE